MSLTVTILGAAVQLTGNPIWIKVEGGTAPEGATGYKYLLQVIDVDSKLLSTPLPDGIVPDSSGIAYFNISGIVDQPINAVFQYPPSGAHVAYPTQAFNLKVKPGESYTDSNGDLQEVWGTESAEFQMLKGGLNPRQVSMMNTDGYTFYSLYIAGRKWLTARPWGEYVHPTQPVKLWFMTVADAAAATFTVKGVYDDGTFQTFTEVLAMSTDYLYEFNCNPAHLGLALEPTGKKMVYFDVWIDFGSSVVSNTRRFTIDWVPCERPIFMLFANSLGGVDDVYFSGYIKDLFSTNSEIAERPVQRTDTVFTPTQVVSSRTGQNSWELNTGYKEIPTLQFYRDLMLSKQAWYLYSNISVTTYIVIPVTVDAGDITIANRKEDLQSFSVKITEAHRSGFAFDNRLY